MVRKQNNGQASVEFIIVIFAVVIFFTIVKTGLEKINLTERLLAPIKNDYVQAYRYGHPKVLGRDDPGGPSFHPRIDEAGNFRIFFNPEP